MGEGDGWGRGAPRSLQPPELQEGRTPALPGGLGCCPVSGERSGEPTFLAGSSACLPWNLSPARQRVLVVSPRGLGDLGHGPSRMWGPMLGGGGG